MSLGSWQPQITTLDTTWLQQFIALGAQEPVPDLSIALDEDMRARGGVMALPEAQWQEAAQALSREQIIALMRFLVVAEDSLTGWEAGAGSPVIHLNRLLKQRSEGLTREELYWIKTHTQNRYLPNGPL